MRRLPWLPFAVVLAFALWQALAARWLCDDAFISFRYAQNLVAGHGLVYNAEERVEGFTNFLWTLQSALAVWSGADPVRIAQDLGIGCFLLTGFVLVFAGRRLRRDDGLLPVAAAAFLLCTHAQEFASCGLETAQFTLLVTLLAAVLVRPERPAHWALAGGLAGLLALSRPDGALFGALAGVLALRAAAAARSWRPFLAYGAPALLLLVPFLLFRRLYFGDWLPNTFYAKSAADPYAGQGLYYCSRFFLTYWMLVPALLAAGLLLLPRHRRNQGGVVLAWMVAVYVGFVVWVGGDFMFGRFLVPVVPLLALLLELLVWRFAPDRARWPALALVAVGMLLANQPAALRTPVHDLGHGIVIGDIQHGIGDERAQYPPARVEWIRGVGRQMRQALGAAPTRVVFYGTQAMLVYEAGFPFALEGTTGLTDRHLARRVLPERGQPGHEKSIYGDPGYVLQRRVHFLLEPFAGLLAAMPWRRIDFFGMPATIVRWDEEVMRGLRGQPGVQFVDFPQFLDDYLAGIAGRDKAAVAADYRQFVDYYFAGTDDAPRRQRFEAFLGR